MTNFNGNVAGYKSGRVLKTLGEAVLGTSLILAPACGGIYFQKTYDKEGNVRASHTSIFGSGSNQMIDGDKVVNDAKQHYIHGYGWGYPTMYGGYWFPYTNLWYYPPTMTAPFPSTIYSPGIQAPWFQGPGLGGGTRYRINEKIDKEKPNRFSLLDQDSAKPQRNFSIIGTEDLPPREAEIFACLVEKYLREK